VYRERATGFAPVLGCAYGKHAVRRLGPAYEPPAAIGSGAGNLRYTLVGTIVAYESVLAEWLVVVRDLRSGKLVHSVPAVTTHPSSPGSVSQIVVKRDGAAAWLAVVEGTAAPRYQLRAVDRAGSRLLASGASIESLALVGGTVYWVQDGRSRSARLG